jgi:hypothetical protein
LKGITTNNCQAQKAVINQAGAGLGRDAGAVGTLFDILGTQAACRATLFTGLEAVQFICMYQKVGSRSPNRRCSYKLFIIDLILIAVYDIQYV